MRRCVPRIVSFSATIGQGSNDVLPFCDQMVNLHGVCKTSATEVNDIGSACSNLIDSLAWLVSNHTTVTVQSLLTLAAKCRRRVTAIVWRFLSTVSPSVRRNPRAPLLNGKGRHR